ncbi:hypothetical protein [Pseudoxanthomonas composti]|uniref:Uncharacterized protein n=1 Tax=Pseudoxanthomonas composti TaxID=2137479 RepID=A0A4Q1JT32_9GAMM|nr:hypothetical protein [Pseudoxanthomonas composti]RXR00852.1 hypothetical protein EPA99_16320 [Pseudoxanthomonas composti]
MKDDERLSLADTTRALAELQALVLAQGAMLDTLIATHPYPVEFREAWDQRVSAVLAQSLQTSAARLADGEQMRVLSPLSHQLQELTEKVLRRAPREP